jgi:uncharacterized membrane protein YebE (DUF533 family)
MFDAKKLLEALSTPAAAAPEPSAAPPASPAPPAPAARAHAAASAPLGAGTILSELIGYATREAPPPQPGQQATADGQPVPAVPQKPAAPPDLTDHLLAKTQEYLRSPQGNAAVNALVFGLAKFVVNSDAGRKLASTAKAGSVALIGELAQRARRLQGPAPAVARPIPAASLPPPDEAARNPEEMPLLILRTMVAAAAADGVIENEERRCIADGMRQAGFDADAARYIEREFARPAPVEELAAGVTTPEEAAQLYAAARVVIQPDKTEERVFLARLAGALALDPRIVAGIDAEASGIVAR